MIDLGAPSVRATRCAIADRSNALSSDITGEILRRQRGQERPFWWRERMFDFVIGNYAANKQGRNWAGSDLSGGSQIRPGGIGDMRAPCVDFVDCVSKKHDLQFWLSANFEAGSQIALVIRGRQLRLIVERMIIVNLRVIPEMFGLLLPTQRRLLARLQAAD